MRALDSSPRAAQSLFRLQSRLVAGLRLPHAPPERGCASPLAQGKPVVLDGAMGSTLYEQGILHTRAFEECNLNAAAKVKAVHLAFIEAGANVIEYVAARARAHACLPTSCMRAHIGACLCLVHVFTPRIAISTPPAGQTRLAPTSTCWGDTACRTSLRSTRLVSALQKKLWLRVARACGLRALWALRLCAYLCVISARARDALYQ